MSSSESEMDFNLIEMTRPPQFFRLCTDYLHSIWAMLTVLLAISVVALEKNGIIPRVLLGLNTGFLLLTMLRMIIFSLFPRPRRKHIGPLNEAIKHWLKLRMCVCVGVYLLCFILSGGRLYPAFLLIPVQSSLTLLDWLRADNQSAYFIEWYEKREREEVAAAEFFSRKSR